MQSLAQTAPRTTSGRHAARTTTPTTAADTFAFAIGDAGDPNQIRAHWTHTGNSTHLVVSGPTGTVAFRLDQIVPLASLLNAQGTFADTLGGADRVEVPTATEAAWYLAGVKDGMDGGVDIAMTVMCERQVSS